jgi:hypothetical protein
VHVRASLATVLRGWLTARWVISVLGVLLNCSTLVKGFSNYKTAVALLPTFLMAHSMARAQPSRLEGLALSAK